MGHIQQQTFVKACASELAPVYPGARIAEIGAHFVNRSAREEFGWASEYVGVDLASGPGVDVVGSGHEFGQSNSYDLALSFEVFEHNPYWMETFLNMVRILKPGGTMVLTCASTGRREHGTERTDPLGSPGTSSLGWTYYRNLRQSDFERRVDLKIHFLAHRFYPVAKFGDLYFLGVKRAYNDKGECSGQVRMFDRVVSALDRCVEGIRASEPPQEPPRKHEVVRAVSKLPLSLARHVLSDKAFHDFAYVYSRAMKRVERSILGDQ